MARAFDAEGVIGPHSPAAVWSTMITACRQPMDGKVLKKRLREELLLQAQVGLPRASAGSAVLQLADRGAGICDHAWLKRGSSQW